MLQSEDKSRKQKKDTMSTQDSKSRPSASSKMESPKHYQSTDNQMDSGFMSGSSLLSSGLCYEDSGRLDSKNLSSPQHHPSSSNIEPSDDANFDKARVDSILDSGIDLGLSERISSLNLTSGPILEAEEESNSPSNISQQQEPRSKLEQMGLTPVHINILKEIYKKDDDGDTQLHIAVIRGFYEVVWHMTRLLPHQALLDIPNDSARTALHLAVASRNAPLTRHLIVCGSSPVARNQKGYTPLHVACRNGDQDVVNALIGQVMSPEVAQARLAYPPNHTPGLLAADLNNYDGQTCIHIAAQGSHKEILLNLTLFGADINAKDCKCGRTALHFAVENRDEDLVRFLLEKCRAAPSILNYAGFSPYQLALANELPAITTLLEELGAEKQSLPATYALEDDFDYEDDIGAIGGSDDFPDDLQIGGFPFAVNSVPAVPVTTHCSPFNADAYF